MSLRDLLACLRHLGGVETDRRSEWYDEGFERAVAEDERA